MPCFVRPNSADVDELTELLESDWALLEESWSDAARKAAAAARAVRKAGGSKQAQQRAAMKAYMSAVPRGSRRALQQAASKYKISATTHQGLAIGFGKAAMGFKQSYRHRADKVKSARYSRRANRQDTMRHMFQRASTRARGA